MLRISLVVLAVVATLAQGAPPSVAADCDEIVLKSCLNSFAGALGFPNGFPSDVATFNAWLLKDLVDNGVTGLTTFCGSSTKFDNCLGTNAQTCLNPKSLEAAGFDEKSAVGYLVVFGQVSVLCGADFNTIKGGFSCYITNLANNVVALNKCQSDFFAAIAKDPANTCTDAQQFLGCADDFFTICGSDVKKASCDIAEGGISVFTGQCKLAC